MCALDRHEINLFSSLEEVYELDVPRHEVISSSEQAERHAGPHIAATCKLKSYDNK